MKTGPICSRETSVSNHLTRRNNPEDGRIHFNRGESIPCRKIWTISGLIQKSPKEVRFLGKVKAIHHVNTVSHATRPRHESSVPWKPQILFRIWQSSPTCATGSEGGAFLKWQPSGSQTFRIMSAERSTPAALPLFLSPHLYPWQLLKKLKGVGIRHATWHKSGHGHFPTHACQFIIHTAPHHFKLYCQNCWQNRFVYHKQRIRSAAQKFLRVSLTSKVHHSRNMVFYPEPHESSS